MKTSTDKLRDRAAVRTFERIRADRDRVSGELKPVFETIEERLFDSELGKDGLWEQCGLGKDAAAARFTREVGVPPWVYVTDCRLEVGEELLLDTDLKVFQIAETLGYPASRGTFSEGFKRRRGLTPTGFRRSGDRPPQAVRREAARAGRGSVGTEMRDLLAQLGLASHERGAERVWQGELDRAWDDLARARRCYGAAGELPHGIRRRRRRIAVGFDTGEALYSALCPGCRASLAGDEGRSVREHLGRALFKVSRELAWFGASCDECYRVVWQAFSRARLGLVQDAWRAWWLSVHADPDGREKPPSRGRVIAALVRAEACEEALECAGYCELAVADASAIGDPRLEAGARTWRSEALLALGRLAEAREELRRAADASRAVPWLGALHLGTQGRLEAATGNPPGALVLLRSSAEQYRRLDPHLAGLELVCGGDVCSSKGRHEESAELYEDALTLLDARRSEQARSAFRKSAERVPAPSPPAGFSPERTDCPAEPDTSRVHFSRLLS